MRLRKAMIMRYRSVDYLEIEMGPLTILFGKNNVGKTNVLEAIYGILAPETMRGYPGAKNLARGVRGDDTSLPVGAVYADLEPGLLFDDDVLKRGARLNRVDEWQVSSDEDTLRLEQLPLDQVSFVFDSVNSGLCFADPQPYFELSVNRNLKYGSVDVELSKDFAEQCCFAEPRPRPLFLDWEFADLSDKVTAGIREFMEGSRWLEEVDFDGGSGWRVQPIVHKFIDLVASLASQLLPDFLDGSIRAQLVVQTKWGEAPWVRVTYEERGTGQSARAVPDIGHGAARWIAACTQIAVHAIANSLADIGDLVQPDKRSFSGDVLFIDEPEAHLHHTAVDSIRRWCQRMAKSGFNIIVASHHEAFLRASGEEVRFVKISRDGESSSTQARTVLSTATPLLQELATEVGMHPATVLSLHRAIVFVEGPLDEAVLDEYAGPALDAAGVLIIPIHGTKNLEGLVDGEFPARLGIKTGVLTDATVTETIWDRSNRKRSSEEVKLVRLIKRFEDKGLPPPKVFGVPEEDLLFAFPAAAIRDYLKGPFPGWRELVGECRTAAGKGPSDSVDWKAYAQMQYGLDLTTDGVRALVRHLDLADVDLPSIRNVINEVVEWARQP
jgi:energy-coupling factor transporter ATP-binding protein EcfA2